MTQPVKRTQAVLVTLTLVLCAANAQLPGLRTQKLAPRRPASKALGSAPRYDAWRIIGPGGGGTMIAPTISPHDTNIVVEHSDMTGAYITRDGGESWRMFNLRTVVSTFAFDPQNPEVIYAANGALWRSEDTGKTWRMVFPNPNKNTVEHMRGDHSEFILTTDDPAYPASGTQIDIEAIAVDPRNSNRIFIALSDAHIFWSPAEHRPASLYLSEDWGRSWSRVTQFSNESVHGIYIQIDQLGKGQTIYVIGDTGVYKGAGNEWRHLSGPAGEKIKAANMGRDKRSGNPLFYAITSTKWKSKSLSGGVYVSADCGQSWRPSNDALLDGFYNPGQGDAPEVRAIACSAYNASTAYVGFGGLRLGDSREQLFGGIAKTTDGGGHWAVVQKESNTPSPQMGGSWIDERAADGWPNIWFDWPYSLGVAPTNPDICYATDLFRTYRTLDGGRKWKQVHSARVSENHWTTRGLDVTTCYGVHFDPFDLRHMFITYTDIGLFQSHDGGTSWMGSTVGIPNKWRNTTYWIAFDPKVRNLVWGAFSGTHDLPRPKMWRTNDPDNFKGGVAVSRDGGNSWSLSNNGMAETAVTDILIDLTSQVGERTLYACGFGRGVYKSTDNGRTWALKNNGIDKRQPFAWRITRAADGNLYLIVARRSEQGRIGDDDDGALYKSTDRAEHWVKMPLPKGVNGPTGLGIDPTDKRRIYLTAWGVMRPDGDIGGGVFLSRDGGSTWRNIFSQSQHVYDITIDSNNPRHLYICGFDRAAYRSTDDGARWEKIKGYNFKWGHRVTLDPLDHRKVYITTFGGSVWHGPAAGDRAAAGDVITPIRTQR